MHQFDRLVTKLERLLDHRRVDGAALNAVECFVFFIKRHYLYLTPLVCLCDGIEDRRTVITPKADKSDDVRVSYERVRNI